ncbi:MAG TPA: hypothetical protein IAC25_05760 [Candidatus Enterenecus stercoripullorum]|nr:hypothetical protein [Candidatus Enterenecus stercoripullorum]
MEGYWALFWATGLPQAWLLSREREKEAVAALAAASVEEEEPSWPGAV